MIINNSGERANGGGSTAKGQEKSARGVKFFNPGIHYGYAIITAVYRLTTPWEEMKARCEQLVPLNWTSLTNLLSWTRCGLPELASLLFGRTHSYVYETYFKSKWLVLLSWNYINCSVTTTARWWNIMGCNFKLYMKSSLAWIRWIIMPPGLTKIEHYVMV